MKNRLFALVGGSVVAVLLIVPSKALAGPPFLTDDPEPVEYHHSELYLFSIGTLTKDDMTSIVPGVEANYGVLPDVQLHIIAPLVFDATSGQPFHYGFGDMELGIKYRFLRESEKGGWPQAGVFPLLEVPTGDASRNLGKGYAREFLPVWLQKGIGDWLSYGGGGYWNNPGSGNQNYWFFGWLLQRKITDKLNLGGELFYQTADKKGGADNSGFNLGGAYDFTEHYHALFSAGRGIQDVAATNQFSYYLALQVTY